jgi:hypothetical protein
MKELIEKINQANVIQIDGWEEQQFSDEIDKILNQCEIVDTDLDVDKHRWYETSIVVYKLNGEFFGIRYVTDTFSESSSIEDMCWTIKAFPMKEVQTITYIVER